MPPAPPRCRPRANSPPSRRRSRDAKAAFCQSLARASRGAPGGHAAALLRGGGRSPGPRPVYLRFVTLEVHPDSGVASGVFQAASALRALETLSAHERAAVEECFDWFDEHLEVPAIFRSHSSDSRPSPDRAVCWLKAAAHEHVRRLRDLCAFLREHAIVVRELRSQRPGHVVYEDPHQVAAVPFHDTFVR